MGLKGLMLTIEPKPRDFFTRPGGDHDLHDAFSIHGVLVQITREVPGPDVHGHSHRGSDAVRPRPSKVSMSMHDRRDSFI
jgi:hypothetical protein